MEMPIPTGSLRDGKDPSADGDQMGFNSSAPQKEKFKESVTPFE